MRAWYLVLFWMAVIFYFSHQPADSSTETSSAILDIITTYLPFLNSEWSHFLLRKCAHFTEYFILGLLLFRALSKNKKSYTLIIGTLYAFSDELHQYFIPGRACQFTDVLIDSSGLLAAVIFMNYLIKRLSIN